VLSLVRRAPLFHCLDRGFRKRQCCKWIEGLFASADYQHFPAIFTGSMENAVKAIETGEIQPITICEQDCFCRISLREIKIRFCFHFTSVFFEGWSARHSAFDLSRTHFHVQWPPLFPAETACLLGFQIAVHAIGHMLRDGVFFSHFNAFSL
jgi:hypothetical protein